MPLHRVATPMLLDVLNEDAFQFALLHHVLTRPDEIADLWPVPHEPEPAAAA